MTDRPFLRVVRGDPTPEEVAALVAAVTARARATAAAREAEASRPTSHWADRSALVQRTPSPGPGAWRASALPR